MKILRNIVIVIGYLWCILIGLCMFVQAFIWVVEAVKWGRRPMFP